MSFKRIFFSVSFLFGFIFSFNFISLNSQDLSGEWKTSNNGVFYAELHLINNGNGIYSGHSYDEQGGGYCSYRLIGNFNAKRNIFEAKNTSVIQRSPEHRGSNYNLRYSKVGEYEYLKGTVKVISEFSFSYPGIPQMETVPIQVEYFRVAKDPIVEYSKNKKEEDIYLSKKDSVFAVSPLPIPEPVEINKDKIEKSEDEDVAKLPIPVIISPEKPKQTIPDKPIVASIPPKDSIKLPEVEIVEKKPIYNKEELVVFKETRTERVIKTYNSNNSKTIQLKIRDYDEEDGDVISVFLNDELVADNIEIKKKEIVLKVKINPNMDNKFTFIANNLGKVPPNTCEVSFKLKNKTFYDKVFTDEKTNSIVIFKP